MWLHNVNDESDQAECVEDVVIDEFLDLIGGKISPNNRGGDDRMAVDGDVIKDRLQNKSNYLSSSYQMLNYVRKGIIGMVFDTMASTSVFLPHDLIENDIFHGIV